MAGTVHPVQTVELLVVLRRCSYSRAIYFDTFPDTGGLDPVVECRANIDRSAAPSWVAPSCSSEKLPSRCPALTPVRGPGRADLRPSLVREDRLVLHQGHRPEWSGKAPLLFGDVMEGVTETLAGRVAILNLLGLSDEEKRLPRALPPDDYFRRLLETGFSRLHGIEDRAPRDLYLSSYMQTYIERDIRELHRVPARGPHECRTHDVGERLFPRLPSDCFRSDQSQNASSASARCSRAAGHTSIPSCVQKDRLPP